MAKSSYWELLQHPLWQKKRLEVLSRENFTCEDCGSGEKMLHVHHSYYEKGLQPWEYPDESLHSLCADCHQKAQDWMQLLHRQIGQLPLYQIETLLGFALALYAAEHLDEPIPISSYGMAEGFANFFSTNAGFVIAHIQDGVIDAATLLERLGDWARATHDRGGI